MSTRFLTHLPSHDGHPGAVIDWPEECQQAFARGVALAEDWLGNANSGWLWTGLLVERNGWPLGTQRHAFEVGFLSRIHQRLCSPLGGNHQARLARLQV